MASMEHPLFTLATRPDRRILRYAHGEATIEVTPSVKGLATIHDKDVLIFCISQLMAAVNAGRPTAPTLHLKAHDLLLATRRETSRRRLPAAARGLRAAVGHPDRHQHRHRRASRRTRGFGLIDAWEILRKARGGRMILVTVTLSDWIYRSVLSRSVLTLQPRLFRAAQAAGAAGLRDRPQALRPAGGVADRARDAAEEVGLDLAAAGVPQDDPRHGRRGRAAGLQPGARRGRRGGGARARAAGRGGGGARGSAPEIHARVRAAAPGYDPYWLEAEWRRFWQASGRPRLRSPEAAFLAFARARAQRADVPRAEHRGRLRRSDA